MSDGSDTHGAFRAAGQLVAALAEGLAIESVSSEGIVLPSGNGPPRDPRRREVLAEIAIGLAGIAAVDRYAFGTLPPPAPGRYDAIVHWNFDALQLADFEEVHQLVALIDRDGEDDVFYLAWEQASSLIDDDATWEAIEFFATLLQGTSLDGADIDYICPDLFGGLKGLASERGDTADGGRPSRSLG